MSEVRRRRRFGGDPGTIILVVGALHVFSGVSDLSRWLTEPGPTVWLAQASKSPSQWVVAVFVGAFVFSVSFRQGHVFGRSRGVGLALLFMLPFTLFCEGVIEAAINVAFGVLVLWGGDDDPPVRAARRLWEALRPRPAMTPLPVNS